MKKVVFIASHLGANSGELVNVLNKNPRILIHKKQAGYFHLASLDWLFEEGHKINSSAAIYGDQLLFDANFTCKTLYRICGFIYLIRPGKPSLDQIIKHSKYTPENACTYYRFRLRRICEMARSTPGSVLLTWNDLVSGKGFSLIEEYLRLKVPLDAGLWQAQEQLGGTEATLELCEKAQDAYERHLYYLKHLDLIKVT